MRQAIAAFARSADPRLKLALALALGPGLWLLPPLLTGGLGLFLLFLLLSLSASQPLGGSMVRSMFLFVFIWVGIKTGLDVWSDLPLSQVLLDSAVLGLRLASLLMLGLSLSLAASPRALGLAMCWVVRPFVGAERAWKFALSLALMIHFLPVTLSTMNQANETLTRRCPRCGIRDRMRVVPQAVLRNLGQKTWSQTLAVAGRGLESGAAWQPDFHWTISDSFLSLAALGIAVLLFLF